MIGGVRPVGRVDGPSTSSWLRRRKDGLEAQHRALDEGRIDDLVKLMRDEQEEAGRERDDDRPEDGPDETVDEIDVAGELEREVIALAQRLEHRITRVRAETLAELQDLDGRIEAGRFGTGPQGEAGGRRGGKFNGYL
ncbi:hypothetical protein [Gaopeijia maritima]|uniref:Uncharacterized protein n=1 Tax=Gaopeijia maritima TaxID=3119007 RepID=A0ABU9EDD3_9BACT